MDDDEIAVVLDLAKQLKGSMLQKVSSQDIYTPLVFLQPAELKEETSITYLETWYQQKLSGGRSQEEIATAGALAIWWLSLAAATFAETRFKGKEMWSQLSRGFAHCQLFQPNIDVPKGLEPQHG